MYLFLYMHVYCLNSERMCDMCERYGVKVARIDKPWGEVFDLKEIEAAIETHKPALFFIVHAETR